MQNAESIEILREREHNLEKISFVCDAKKAENKLVILIKNRIKKYINKTDYLRALKKIEFLMLKGSLFFR